MEVGARMKERRQLRKLLYKSRQVMMVGWMRWKL